MTLEELKLRLNEAFSEIEKNENKSVDVLIISESLISLITSDKKTFDECCYTERIMRGGNYIGNFWLADVFVSNKLREGEFICVAQEGLGVV